MKIDTNGIGGNVYELATIDEETVIRIGVNPHFKEVPFGMILIEKANHNVGRLIDRTTGFNLSKDNLDELIKDLQAAKESYEKGEKE
ncbi:hypothetical protein [Vagococcus fluvialis]|uniref:hypothetical protein n=1 Tax=Vagococcus fluvialis TaxID=2738 RepID=UPI001D0BB4F7|nr:hypothetical protein [Vagococcus fluvialis]UDM72682.1 hypothetical protein K5L00_14950 [Vagococcus fluvialis]UDM78405.1 hypothetical protein K5K98_14285 [Vagococcus fluvialis]UDM83957.1 hypothetical protein K5K96_14975 [Vagococcus fluvialis]